MLVNSSNLLFLIEGKGLFGVVVILPPINEDLLEECFITPGQKLFDVQWHTWSDQN